MLSTIRDILLITSAAGILVVVGVYWGKFKWLIKRHEEGRPGERLEKKFTNFVARFDMLWDIINKQMVLEIRNRTKPRMDLLLDKMVKRQASVDELHELGSLLRTELTESASFCTHDGKLCTGDKLAMSIIKAQAEVMINDRIREAKNE